MLANNDREANYMQMRKYYGSAKKTVMKMQQSTCQNGGNLTTAGTSTDQSEHRKIRSSTAARHHVGSGRSSAARHV